MSRDKQIEDMALTEVDILANDLNQHCADLAETYCGDTNCLTCLAYALTNKGYRKASDVASEISQDIIEPLWNAYKNSTCQETVLLVALICETINNQLKKKYESEGEGC